jgi:hypothetical protein
VEAKSESSGAEKQRQRNAGKNRKNNSNKSKKIKEMRAEYDFSGGVRGKHAASYREKHTVTCHKKDGSTVIQNFKLKEGAVVLAPDVREYFPDAESVNNALRTLISIAPKSRKKTSKPRTGHKQTAQSAQETLGEIEGAMQKSER